MPPVMPLYITITFILTTIATLLLLYRAVIRSASAKTRAAAKFIFIGMILWLTLQAILTLNNVYSKNPAALPPTILLLGVLPLILLIIILFATKKGRLFIDGLPLADITYIHIVRIPVEIVLYWLFLQKTIPQLMTFEGRNFDIIAGITAPFIAWLGIIKAKLTPKIIIAWNILCLLLLLNIVVNALLSAPTPLQQFAFDQPNIAILYFPFSWLPVFIVPVVLFAHLVSLRQLVRQARQDGSIHRAS
jgi:hypothetical protein